MAWENSDEKYDRTYVIARDYEISEDSVRSADEERN